MRAFQDSQECILTQKKNTSKFLFIVTHKKPSTAMIHANYMPFNLLNQHEPKRSIHMNQADYLSRPSCRLV